MKFNKWTLGLAAVGAVSMASAVRADEAKLSQVQTALSNTIISGYVSASANWEASPSGGGNSIGGNIPLQGGKANGFNLDVVKLSIAKAQDETPWAAGYQVDLLFGPDAVGYNPSANAIGGQHAPAVQGTKNNQVSLPGADFGILQAYVALRTPVGNGIDWKIGQFNTVIGYESFDAASNPNFTRSWGWAVEPTTHTGILGSYKVNDELSFSAGVANTLMGGINTRNNYKNYKSTSLDGPTLANDGAWSKTLMGSVTFTAPSNWGWASGSAFSAGLVYGFNNAYQSAFSSATPPAIPAGSSGGDQGNYYVGATLNSPWKDVTFGACFDYVQNVNGGSGIEGFHANDYIAGLYNTIKAMDKLSFNSRAEYWEIDAMTSHEVGSYSGISLTETVEYDLWANVVSRVEFRADQVMTGSQAALVNSNVEGFNGPFNGGYFTPTGVAVNQRTSYGVYANVVYKF